MIINDDSINCDDVINIGNLWFIFNAIYAIDGERAPPAVI